VRGGQNIPLTVQIKEMPENFNTAQANPNQPPSPGPRGGNPPAPAAPATPPSKPNLLDGPLAGVDVIDLTPRLAARLDMPPETKGVVINQINPDSPAADVLRDGDMIEEVTRHRWRPRATSSAWSRHFRRSAMSCFPLCVSGRAPLSSCPPTNSRGVSVRRRRSFQGSLRSFRSGTTTLPARRATKWPRASAASAPCQSA